MHIKLVSSFNDVNKVVSLSNEIFGNYYQSIIGEEQTEYMLKKFLSKPSIKENIKEGTSYFLINNEEQDVGFIALQYRSAFLYISKFYIKEEMRGQGYFNKTFNLIKAIAFKHNYKSIKLNVNKHNDLAISIYEHAGFKRIASEVIDIGSGFSMDDYVYEYQFK